MKNVILFLVVVTLLVFNSCEKKTNHTILITENNKVITNKSIPLDPGLKIDMEFIGQINSTETIADTTGFNWMVDIEQDLAGSYFILGNNENAQLNKYDKNFNLLRSFSKKGQGPSESDGYTRILILNNKLYAFFNHSDKVNIFDLNGEFIESFRFGFIVTEINKLSEERIVVTKWEHLTLEGNKSELTIENILMDNNFNEIKIFDSIYKIIEGTVSASSLYYPYICGNSNEIHISWLSMNEYKINVYDVMNGEKKYEIRKNYTVDHYSDIEMNWLSEKNKVDMKKMYGNIKKRAINEIFIDKYDRLWVLATKKRNENNISYLYADIFKEGVYQKTLEFQDLVYYDGTGSRFYYKLRFLGDKMIYFNADEFDDEKGRNIKFYDY